MNPTNYQSASTPVLAYDYDAGKLFQLWQEYTTSWAWGDIYYSHISISGTTPTATTATSVSSGGAYGQRLQAAFDSGNNRGVVAYDQSSSLKYATYKASSTNITSSNYLGLSSAAYSNGATATINVTGSVSTVQSGLTIGTSYYIQNDGSLGTGSNTGVKAGLALSSSSLLIKEN